MPAQKNPIARTQQFLGETQAELKKVSWSTRQEVISATTVVIIATTLMALYIGFCDLVLSRALSLILS
jgi:preprotein translocase subunit SecE